MSTRRFRAMSGLRPFRKRNHSPRFERLEGRLVLSTYTVNSGGDEPDKDPNDGQALTSGGLTTLRAAIQQANIDGGGTILFNSGLTIQPGSTLPALATPILMDGKLQVEIRGGNAIAVGLIVNGGCTVKGLVMNGFTAAAITFYGTESGAVDATGIVIDGNYLGTNRAGTAAAGTQGAGIDVLGKSVSSSIIRNNVISGNSYGIRLVGSNNQITSNLIGTDKAGTRAIPNRIGVLLDDGSANTLRQNVIAGNFEGLEISKAHDNTIQQNFIGTDKGSTLDLGNSDQGILIESGGNNWVGGDSESDGNTIAFNGQGVSPRGNGVRIRYSSGNRILSNRMYRNANRGIAIYDDLGDSWDEGDSDGGPNGFQNAPYVAQATSAGETWHIQGKPGATYHVQVFQASGNEEAGSARSLSYDMPSVTADSTGIATFTTARSAFLTATATDSEGNTSEFGYSDTDGDALYDTWEKRGIDWDLDGQIDLDLAARGALYLHKDVFVEIDAMATYGPRGMETAYEKGFVTTIPAGVAPTGTALDAVISAYAKSSVSNPDGGAGIRLHLNVDNSLSIESATSWSEFDGIKDRNIGTPDERSQPNWNAIKESLKASERYALFGGVAGSGDYGISENGSKGTRPYLAAGKLLGGNDIRIFIGGMRKDGFDNPLNEAVTFMHELGHSLGLAHGGEDDINFKPNYHSIMNYAWALANPESTTTDARIKNSFVLDYSHGGLNTIAEAAVNEASGIGGKAGSYVPVYTNPTGTQTKVVIVAESGLADFNANGKQDSTYPLILSDPGLHAALLNSFFTLHDYDDWSNLVYNFRESGSYKDSQHLSADEGDGRYRVDPANVSIPAGSADLAIDQSTSAGTVKLGQNVTFTVKVTNKGPNAAANVNVLDVIPNGLTFVSAATSQGTFTNSAGRSLAFQLGSLANGGTATLTIVVKAAGPGVLAHVASVWAGTADPVTGNNISVKGVLVTQALALQPPVGATLQQGAAYAGTFGFSDTAAGPWTAAISYGDGTPLASTSYASVKSGLPLSHVYLVPGLHYLTVTVTNSQSHESAVARVAIDTQNKAPVAAVADAAASAGIVAGSPHNFDLRGTDVDPRLVYRMNWGDGSPVEDFVGQAAVVASHTFAKAGGYTLRLVVIDPQGVSSSPATLAVTVKPAPATHYPTAVEQEYLERLNDARANPTAYGQQIGIDLSQYPPLMPEAFDPGLEQAAWQHSVDMYVNGYFSHYSADGSGPNERASANGFRGLVAESIAYGTYTADDILSQYVIDAGVPDVGHRIQMVGLEHRVAGVGIVGGFSTIDTGINLIQDDPYLTGAVFDDRNRNGRYDAGEGLGGVTITVAGVGSTTSWSEGGYSMLVKPGTYTVTASGGGLTTPLTQTATFHYSSKFGLWENARASFAQEPPPGSLPNDLIAPAGAGPNHAILGHETLGYSLRFKNTQSGDPAQSLTISLPPPAGIDWSTFQFGTVQIGTTQVAVPAGRQSYSTQLAFTNSAGRALKLNVSMALNPQHVATWTFQSLDPRTNQAPTDASLGFLQTLDGGSVSWSARPVAGLPSGTRIAFSATELFQQRNGSWSVSSPAPFNTIDTTPPTSRVGSVAATQYLTRIDLKWAGSDNAGGAGVAYYDVYASVDGGSYTRFLTQTTLLSASFTGSYGHTYRFYCVATDLLGNREATPTGAQAKTVLVRPAPATVQFKAATFSANVHQLTASLVLTRSKFLASSVTVSVSSSGGRGVAAFRRSVTFAPNVKTMTLNIPLHDDHRADRKDSRIRISLSASSSLVSLGTNRTATLVVHRTPLIPAPVSVVSSSLQTVSYNAHKLTGLVLRFSGALDAKSAQSASAYKLWAPGKDNRLRTSDDVAIGVSQAFWLAGSRTVILVPATALRPSTPVRLQIIATRLLDSRKRYLDGNKDGTLGGNYDRTVSPGR